MVEMINELIKNSTNKKILLERIMTATKNQSEAIERNDLEKLDLIINEKQEYINDINILDDDFEIIFAKVKESVGLDKLGDVLKSNNEVLIGLKNNIQDIIKIIQEVKLIEDKNYKKLSFQKDEAGKKMRELTKGKIAHNVYSGNHFAPPNPAFIDKKK